MTSPMRYSLALAAVATILAAGTAAHARDSNRLEAALDLGGATATGSPSAPKGLLYGTTLLYRFGAPLALGPVIHRLSWSDESLAFLMVGPTLRLYLPIGSRLEPYLQLSGGPVYTSGSGDTPDVRHHAWFHGGLGLDLKLVDWLKAGVQAGWLKIGPTSVSCSESLSGTSGSGCGGTPGRLSPSFTIQGAATFSFEL